MEEVMSYIKFEKVCKSYKLGHQKVSALNDMSFEVEDGEFCIVAGQSGAGKTTLLNVMGGIDTVDEGKVIIDGNDITKCTQKQMTDYRRHHVGFVFQFYNLVQGLSAKENVELASEICREPFDADYVLELVGLEKRKNNFPSQLSGGEQQRVAIARAVAKNPKLLLCDEPTGALDYNTGKNILELLHRICKSEKKTLVLITHNLSIVSMADRIINMKNGSITSCEKNYNVKNIRDLEW